MLFVVFNKMTERVKSTITNRKTERWINSATALEWV